jgi:hypothetical protein
MLYPPKLASGCAISLALCVRGPATTRMPLDFAAWPAGPQNQIHQRRAPQKSSLAMYVSFASADARLFSNQMAKRLWLSS